MGSPRRFLFDVSFDTPDPSGPDGMRTKPAEPRFTRADIDAAHAAGLAEGRDAAFAEAAQTTTDRTAAALDAIGQGMATLIDAQAALARTTESQAIAVLRTALQRAVPALCRKDPLAEIEALVAGCIGEALDEPRLVVRVNDALFDAVQQRIGAIAATGGYSGKIVLLADAALADGDGRVEWADGGAERDTRRIAGEIDAILAHAIAAPSQQPCPSEETVNG